MLLSPFISAGDGKSLPDIYEIGVPYLKIKEGAFILSSRFLLSVFMLLKMADYARLLVYFLALCLCYIILETKSAFLIDSSTKL